MQGIDSEEWYRLGFAFDHRLDPRAGGANSVITAPVMTQAFVPFFISSPQSRRQPPQISSIGSCLQDEICTVSRLAALNARRRKILNSTYLEKDCAIR